MKPGAPDLFLFLAEKAYGLKIKRPGGVLSPVQGEFHDKLARAGVPVATVFSADGAECALHGWDLPRLGAEAAAAPWRP